jgi:TatD DNase family protein
LSYIDFHCHLDLYPDFPAAVKAAESAGVYTLAVTTTPQAWPRNAELTRGMKFVRAALGHHPQLAAQFPKDVSLWDSYLEQTRYVGEVGLDAGPRYYKSFELQKEIFTHVLKQCSSAPERKILSIHSVRAADAVLSALEKELTPVANSVVLHWFTGSPSALKRAVAMGCYFSLNEQMLKTDSGRATIATIPLDRLLTETDGPFTSHRDRPAVPSDMPVIVGEVASHLRFNSETLHSLLLENMKRLLA